MTPPPDHILAAFGIGPSTGERLAGGSPRAWRFGDVVLSPVADPVEAAWIAGVLESIRVTGIRVTRPVRSSDGRWVVGGWAAQRFVSGRPSNRYDDIIATSASFHRALEAVPMPRFLTERQNVSSWADRLAWGETTDKEGRLGEGHGLALYRAIADGVRPVRVTNQVIHGDLFGHVLFAGSAPPAVVGFSPYWRPADYAAAVLVTDAVAWGGADADLAERWSGLNDWGQLLRRAVLFRLALSLAHPRTTPESLVDMLSGAEVLRPVMGD